MSTNDILTNALAQRILVLDGGFGTMLQHYDLADAITSAPGKPGGCNDMLSITRPDVVSDIHQRYLDAGADIIETNSFNANAISLADYGLADKAYDISLAAAKLARKTVDAASTANKPRFVAGSMGPTNCTLSMSADVSNPGAREVTYSQMRDAYTEQARGLIDGGADIIIIETVFDTLNAKAAIDAVRKASNNIPIIISATIADTSGRMLTGQTIEAFCASVAHAKPLALGLNCGFGADSMLPHLRTLARVCDTPVSVHPNAGLPNVDGGYDETPEMFVKVVRQYLDEQLVNIIGGCCGTTPEHIRLLAKTTTEYKPRQVANKQSVCVLSGLEPLRVVPETNFINIGERTNVAGSAKFARLIREGSYDEALAIAKAQVEAGAQIVDVCMDAPMIDAPTAMTRFINLMASEPEIARVPVMIDSSDFAVIEAGLQCIQGKGVVNSISLKEGEDVFIDHARKIMSMGAAAVVMLFDEKGQADTYQRKIEVAQRAYKLLKSIGFAPTDIIFDPNILAIATGMPQHDTYARDFIEATRWIKNNLPGAKVSGGVSNLSFAFRGNNTVRKAMHSVFLYHAIQAGMDMAIVNPQMVQIYDDIEPQLLERVEDLILYRRDDAADRLIELASQLADAPDKANDASAAQQWRTLSVDQRIAHAMLKGDNTHISADTIEAYNELGSAVAVINKMLMPAMTEVGHRFAEGKLFLPQVVKSARVMKQAVAALEPFMPVADDAADNSNTIVIATVKGDVHDIGKNIVAVVLACNGYKVIDLGVMVEPDRIIDEAVASGACAICLSGLITPSLNEMIRVVQMAQQRGLTTPIVVGGATTSDLHTAVKMAPEYDGVVVHSTDAAQNSRIIAALVGDDRQRFINDTKNQQQKLRDSHLKAADTKHQPTYCQCCNHTHKKAEADTTAAPMAVNVSLEEAVKHINWSFFFSSWGIPGRYPQIFDDAAKGDEARKLFDDAQLMLQRFASDEIIQLKGVISRHKATVDGDNILLTTSQGQRVLPMLRNQLTGECVCDFVDDEATLFALSGAFGLESFVSEMRKKGDDYSAIMAKLLCDRLTEAMADILFPGGCRLAIGYPSIPDHSLKRDVFDILNAEEITGMRLTESCMIVPGEAICGIWLERGKYIDSGKPSSQARADYAARRGFDMDTLDRFMPENL